jgi:hypothetical protein
VKDYEDYIYKVHKRYLTDHDKDSQHRWRNWDHWLDQHIGIKYAGSSMISSKDDDDTADANMIAKTNEGTTPKKAKHEASSESSTGGSRLIDDGENDELAIELDENCIVMAKEVTEVILDEHLLVGERFILADGDHYYVGFEGSSLSVEFNTECHYGNVGISDICTCVEMNSEDWAMAHYDAKFSSCYSLHEN